MNFKFTVVKISHPELVTGEITDIKPFNDPLSAFEFKESLGDCDDTESFYEIIVDEIK